MWLENIFAVILNGSLRVPERYEKCLRVSSSVKEKSLSTPPSGREWATSYMANVGENQMNPGIRFFPLPCANGHVGGR